MNKEGIESKAELGQDVLQGKKLAVLGSGNMAAAIGRGLAAQHSPLGICFYDIDFAKADSLAQELGQQAADTLSGALAGADMLLLAVKPQSMDELMAELAPLVSPGQLVISIAAGIPLAYYESRLPGVAVVRAMPNTSAAVQSAITGLMAGSLASEAHRLVAGRLFDAVGSSLWIDEGDIHALIAVSGSGPAYFYYFTECLAAAGEKLGLTPDVAAELARQTAIGSGRMLAARTESPAELRIQVTSKGGTTAAALSVWQQELPGLAEKALGACATRSREMAEESGC